MWAWWQEKKLKAILPVHQIQSDWLKQGWFIFFGKLLSLENKTLDKLCEEIISIFEELLPIYVEIEKGYFGIETLKTDSKGGSVFVFDNTTKQPTIPTSYSREQISIDPQARHAEIQKKLGRNLKSKYVEQNVAVENPIGRNKIDLVLRQEDSYTFFEIKTAHNALLCIRQAIGQLLEYAYYPNAENAKKLVIVSEHQLDENAEKYLNFLKTKFGLPLDYQQVTID
jgi:hypothetical protein